MALQLIYLVFSKLLSWMVLRTRSDTAKAIEILVLRLYRAKTRSQARDLQVDPPTHQGMITRWPRDCST